MAYIKKTCEILKRDYEGDIPPTVKEMCQLPGVGPKMAHLCMDIGWGKLTGIGKWRSSWRTMNTTVDPASMQPQKYAVGIIVAFKAKVHGSQRNVNGRLLLLMTCVSLSQTRFSSLPLMPTPLCPSAFVLLLSVYPCFPAPTLPSIVGDSQALWSASEHRWSQITQCSVYRQQRQWQQ